MFFITVRTMFQNQDIVLATVLSSGIAQLVLFIILVMRCPSLKMKMCPKLATLKKEVSMTLCSCASLRASFVSPSVSRQFKPAGV